MRKKQRFAFLALGGLGLLAAIAPGLAAGISVNTPASGTPAAGQGSIQVQGFVVEDINWTVSDEGKVTQVTFDIFRTGECDPGDPGDPVVYDCSVASSTVKDGNATVRVSLKTTSRSNWSACAVANLGKSICNTSSAGINGAGIDANDLTEVEVLAFDSN